MSELKRHDREKIRKAISILFKDVKFGDGECVEVRVPDKKKRITAAGWFDDVGALEIAVAKLARDGFGEGYKHIHENAYWTCNPASDALLARQPKNTIAIAADTTSDNNITRRLWLPIDIDPLRPSGGGVTPVITHRVRVRRRPTSSRSTGKSRMASDISTPARSKSRRAKRLSLKTPAKLRSLSILAS